MLISAGGLKLIQLLDGMDVEQFWQPGVYVDWKTGVEMPFAEGYENVTHCSAFAAAVALKLFVPFLDPPPEILLENKQAEWLRSLPSGWQSVSGPLDAQSLANRGWLVVTTFINPHPEGSGHIQIARGDEIRTDADIHENGPQIIQASKQNSNSITAAKGFSIGYESTFSPYPWPDHVSYYAHETQFSDPA